MRSHRHTCARCFRPTQFAATVCATCVADERVGIVVRCVCSLGFTREQYLALAKPRGRDVTGGLRLRVCPCGLALGVPLVDLAERVEPQASAG